MLDFPELFAPKTSVIGRSGMAWVSANALKLVMASEVNINRFVLMSFVVGTVIEGRQTVDGKFRK